MSDANVALGVKLQVGDGATPTEAFTTIAEITDIPGGPSTAAEDVECTSFDSGGWREFKKGLKDGGEISFEANAVADDATHGQLISDSEDGTIRNYKIDWDDATVTLTVPTVQTFSAYVKSATPAFSIGQITKLNVTLKVTGAVGFTARHAGT